MSATRNFRAVISGVAGDKVTTSENRDTVANNFSKQGACIKPKDKVQEPDASGGFVLRFSETSVRKNRTADENAFVTDVGARENAGGIRN
jgi:hypothetical protein